MLLCWKTFDSRRKTFSLCCCSFFVLRPSYLLPSNSHPRASSLRPCSHLRVWPVILLPLGLSICFLLEYVCYSDRQTPEVDVDQLKKLFSRYHVSWMTKEVFMAASMMNAQHYLPTELWTRAFQMFPNSSSWPPGEDIQNVRLVCRFFENLATPFLLDSVRCGPLSRELTILTAISLHPVVSRSVKEIVYICSRYQMMRTTAEYREALVKSGYPITPESHKYDPGLESAFLQHNQHYNDQTEMENSGEVVARLCSALMRMPNVEKVTISPNCYCHLEDFNLRYFLEPEAAYDGAFLLVTLALSLTGTNIRELHIESDDTTPESSGMSATAFREMSSMSLGHCCNAFRELRRVSMEIKNDVIDGWMPGHLAEILSSDTNLEYLWFDGGGYGTISVKYALSTTVWSHLMKLSLFDVALDQAELLDLLRRHSGTLKDLWLYRVYLIDGSWEVVVEWMKASLSLKNVRIENVTGSNDEGSMIDIFLPRSATRDYFLGNGHNPFSVENHLTR